LSVLNENFLMLENSQNAARLLWSAERSALLADALRRSQSLRLRVYGESMLPTLWPGDVVEIAGCSLEEVRPGEIVLALHDGRLFLHRLLASESNGFVLRGDSMPGPDPLYPAEALLGRLVNDTDSGTNRKQSFTASAWNRGLGLMFCHCSIFRRVALKFHRRRSASARQFRIVESL
jgi:hypothetical protein